MSQTARITVRPPKDDPEFRALLDSELQSFNGFGQPPEFMERWLNHIGRENLRVAVRGGQVLGGFGAFFFGQWFGGCSVPSAGVSAVAVNPESRGSGAATALMRDFIRECAQRDIPLAVLYPSTWALYRAAGYEIAGARTTYNVEIERLGASERSLSVRRMTPADRAEVAALQSELARRENGTVDRTERQWSRMWNLAVSTVIDYVVESPGGRIDGYVIYSQREVSDEPFVIRLRDVGFRTPEAGRRVLTLFGDHGTVVRNVEFDGAPVDPLLALSRLETLKVRTRHFWMLRIVNAAAALAQRGYPRGLSAELSFDLTDDVIADNNGRFTLRVEDGIGKVRRVAAGKTAKARTAARSSVNSELPPRSNSKKAMSVSIRGLATIYSGHMTAHQARLAGLADGSDEALATATTIFAGSAPWMNDSF